MDEREHLDPGADAINQPVASHEEFPDLGIIELGNDPAPFRELPERAARSPGLADKDGCVRRRVPGDVLGDPVEIVQSRESPDYGSSHRAMRSSASS